MRKGGNTIREGDVQYLGEENEEDTWDVTGYVSGRLQPKRKDRKDEKEYVRSTTADAQQITK